MRYFVGFLAVIAVIVAVFVLILRGLGNHGPQTTINMLDYAYTNTTVRLSVDGPVSAEQTHQSYRITVGRDTTTIEVLQGYQGQVTQVKTYANNSQAYAAFLRSLDLQGFTKGNTDPTKADERGNCADGLRYVYEIMGNTKDVERYWSTSCGKGTFGGNASKVRLLFIRQVPDFTTVTHGVSFSLAG